MVMVTQTRSMTMMTPRRIMMIFWRHHCLGHDRSHGPHPLPLHVGRCDVRQVLQLRQNHPHIVIAVFIEMGVSNTVMIWIVFSGSQDKTVRFWDLRTRGCVNVVSYQVWILLVTITIPVYLHHFVTITITLMLTTIPTRRLNLGTQGDLQSPPVVSILQVFLHLLFSDNTSLNLK